MGDYSKVEMLSPADRDMLVMDLEVFRKGTVYGKYILPLMVILSFLSFYYDWFDILKVLTSLLAFGSLFSMIVSLFQIRNIKRDLDENVKKTTSYVLEGKFAEGYISSKASMKHGSKVRRRVAVNESQIKAAITYKEGRKDALGSFFSQDDSFDEVLRYTYWFMLKDDEEGGKAKKHSGPIEYYLVGKAGDTIALTHAIHSKKIFKIQA